MQLHAILVKAVRIISMSDHEPPKIGVVSDDKTLFYQKSRRLWVLTLDPDHVDVPKVGIKIGDTLAFVAPNGVAYEAVIRALGSIKMLTGRRRLQLHLDGEGQFLNEVEVGCPIYLGSWKR